MSAYSYPTEAELDERIAFLTRNPDRRPPSGDYCRACMASGMFHCGEPTRKHERGGCGQRVAYPAARSIEEPPLIPSNASAGNPATDTKSKGSNHG